MHLLLVNPHLEYMGRPLPPTRLVGLERRPQRVAVGRRDEVEQVQVPRQHQPALRPLQALIHQLSSWKGDVESTVPLPDSDTPAVVTRQVLMSR
jgi:hypothetical protein